MLPYVASASLAYRRECKRIWLEVNGVVKQDGNLDEMIWPVADTIGYLSRHVVLASAHWRRATACAAASTASLGFSLQIGAAAA